MTDFIFKMTDGSKYVMHNIPADKQDAIWDNIDAWCSQLESETVKVRTVISERK